MVICGTARMTRERRVRTGTTPRISPLRPWDVCFATYYARARWTHAASVGRFVFSASFLQCTRWLMDGYHERVSIARTRCSAISAGSCAEVARFCGANWISESHEWRVMLSAHMLGSPKWGRLLIFWGRICLWGLFGYVCLLEGRTRKLDDFWRYKNRSFITLGWLIYYIYGCQVTGKMWKYLWMNVLNRINAICSLQHLLLPS